MDLVTVIAAAIDTVPSAVPSTVPAPSPDGGGGGVLAWWDDLVPVIAALVGAGLGFLASYVQSKKDRAHAENAAQRQAVADFWAEYGALAAEEKHARFVSTAMANTPAYRDFSDGTRRDLSTKEWKARLSRKIRRESDSLWQRFETAHQVLQFRLVDPEVAKAADDFRWKATGIRAEALEPNDDLESLFVASSVFSGDRNCGADEFEMVARANLIGPRGNLTIRNRVDRFRWKRLQRKGGTAKRPPTPRNRRDTPAADADPNE